MIAFVLKKPAYQTLMAYHFVIIDLHGNKAKWSNGRFMIHEDWQGGYSYFRITRGKGPGGSIAVEKIHHASEIFPTPRENWDGFAELPCHYEGDKLIEGGFEEDYI
jgi:hypothetical protein